MSMFPDLTTYKTNPSMLSLQSQKLKALLSLQTCPSLNHSEIFSFIFLSSLPLKFLFYSHTRSGTGGGTFFFHNTMPLSCILCTLRGGPEPAFHH